jgi:DNA-binding Lrp family transcriptional regulator
VGVGVKRPAFQFYPADWRKDVELQSCSMAAQGLWINVMCLAHECEPYGHLTINGKAMSAAQLGRQVGLSAKECEALLNELVDAGVARKTDEGVIYSKRMVSDERLRSVRAESGRLGGNPALVGRKVNQKDNQPPNQSDKQSPTPSSSSSSSTSVDKEPTALAAEDADASRRPPPCPTERIVELYHRHLPTLPRVDVLNDTRKRAVSARWREVLADQDIKSKPDPRTAAIEFFDWYFDHAAKSRFLTGRAKDWRADFDFLMTPTKFVKVIEGHYHKEAA